MGSKCSMCFVRKETWTKVPPRRPRHEFLSDKERLLVTQTWSRLITHSNVQAMGERIFLRIFQLQPETKNAFYMFSSLTTEAELMENPIFRCHATRFMRAVEVTMKNLDGLDIIVVPNLLHLGRRHTTFYGFKLDYLRTFEIAMEDIWRQELGCRFDKKTRSAWRKIFHMITSKVLEGYREATVQNQCHQKEVSIEQDLGKSVYQNDSSSDAFSKPDELTMPTNRF